MRSSHAAFAALLLLGSAGAAKAATITENLVGQISGPNTTDTFGLFGPAGANLVNQPISIHFQYTAESFNSSKECRTHVCMGYISQGSPNTPGSVLITVTVNGKRLTYSPTYEGVVTVPKLSPYGASSSPNSFVIDSDAYSGQALGASGAQLFVQFLSPPTFNSPLSPADAPVLNQVVGDYIDLFTTVSNISQYETLSFFVSSASQ